MDDVSTTMTFMARLLRQLVAFAYRRLHRAPQRVRRRLGSSAFRALSIPAWGRVCVRELTAVGAHRIHEGHTEATNATVYSRTKYQGKERPGYGRGGRRTCGGHAGEAASSGCGYHLRP